MVVETIDQITMVVIEKIMTLDGGSLGSGIDEERSKVRETMRTAELMEHRYLERKWRPSFTARATSD